MTNKTFFLLSEVAGILNVPNHVLSYAISSGKLAEPELVLGNKRVFSEDDVEKARRYFESKQSGETNMRDKDENEYVSMRVLGKAFGVTSHVMGRWLKELGLRTSLDGKPTTLAFSEKLTDQLPSTNPGTFFYGWHRKRVTEMLKTAGHQPA